jgi:rod shape-determining protein MreC
MFKKKQYVVLGSVLLLTLIVLNLPGGLTARLKQTLGGLFLPLFGAANATEQLGKKAAANLVPRSELLRQNEAFRRDNQELRLRLIQAEAATRENARLHQLLGWQTHAPWKLKLANVVLREPANWWRTVQIDLGSRDGLRENLPVLTADGFLAGRVGTVSLTRAQVILLGDPACRAAALVKNTARDQGVINAGAAVLDTSLVNLGFLSRNAILAPGQNVVTSGQGGIFPTEIPIGTIVDFRSVEFGLYTEARVKLAANLNALEEVWVLFP